MTNPGQSDESKLPLRARVRARTVVAAVLIGTALASIALIGLFNYFSAESLLNDRVEAQLVDLGSSRANRIEAGIRALGDEAVTLATDQGVRAAFRDLTDGLEELDENLAPEQEAALADFYETEINQNTPPGFDEPALISLLPGSERARWLQYHYIVENPFPPELRSELEFAADGSAYSDAHARHHPTLRAISEAGLAGDMLLIDASTGRVVYSVVKSIDFGTDLRLGPHRDTSLARAVLSKLREAPAGEAVFVDFAPYAPAGGTPAAFVAAAIRDQGRLIGSVAIEVPVDRLTAITTAESQWESTGLGETGEIYIVGADRLMRTDSRIALQNPARFDELLADAGYSTEIRNAVEALGTTVLVQPVETEAVETSLLGDRFDEVSRNYLDQETLTVAAPLDIAGVQWVAVAEVTTEEAWDPLQGYVTRLWISAAILVPLVGLLGVLLARRLLRPVRGVMEVVDQVGQGDLTVHLPDRSNDEFGELGRRFNDTVTALREREAELREADEDTTELLSAALPGRLVGQVKEGDRDVAEAVRNATVVVISIEGLADEGSADIETLRDLGVQLSRRLRELADDHRLDPVHSSSSQLLFAAGLESTELEADRAVAFVNSARAEIASFAATHILPLQFSAGLAAGEVAAGLVGTERLAFDVWGEPPRRAMALDAVAAPGQILVDGEIASAVRVEWPVERVAGLVELSGRPLEAWALGESGPRADGDDDATDVSALEEVEDAL